MAKNLHDKQNYNPFRLTSEERAEMDPNYKKPKKKVWNLWFEKTLILSNIFFVSLLQITQKNPSQNGNYSYPFPVVFIIHTHCM